MQLMNYEFKEENANNFLEKINAINPFYELDAFKELKGFNDYIIMRINQNKYNIQRNKEEIPS